MRKKNNLTFVILLILVNSLPLPGQSLPFSGEWKLNREKTIPQFSQVILTQIKVQLKNDSLLTIRTYEAGNGDEYPFEENLSLNGKECRIIVYDMPRTSKATLSRQDGSINIESVTTFYGDNGEDNNKTNETWKSQDGGKTLSIFFTTSTSAGSLSGTQYFNRIK
jgi:hypothetical protein